MPENLPAILQQATQQVDRLDIISSQMVVTDRDSFQRAGKS